MTALNQAYASNDQIIYNTLEISHSSITTMYLVDDSSDLIATLEDSTEVTFSAAGLNISLPEKTTEGRQDLTFSASNIDSSIWDLVDTVITANRTTEERAICKFRTFLPSDLSAPIGGVYTMTIINVNLNRQAATFTVSFQALPDLAYPRLRYYSNIYPSVKYV